MRKTFILFTLSLFFIGFAVNAQMTTVDKVPITKQIVQKVKAAQANVVKANPGTLTASNYEYLTQVRDSKDALLTEGFEIWPPTDWGFFELGDAAGWQQGSDAYSGDASLWHADDNVATGCQDWAMTPALTIDNADYLLMFWEFLYYGGSYIDQHKVSVFDGPDPSTATELGVLYDAAGTDTWTQQILPLAAYNGQTIYIGFYYQGDYADEWAIDNVVVKNLTNDEFAVTDLSVNYLNMVSTAIPVSVTVTNGGLVAQSKTVTFKSNGLEIGTATTASLAYGESEIVSVVDWTPTVTGEYTISAEIVADDDVSNNSLSSDIFVASETQLAENFEGDFLPLGWAQTADTKAWSQVDGTNPANAHLTINGDATTLLAQVLGNPEELLITRPLVLDGSISTLSFWTRGLNNVYGVGSSTLQLKYRVYGEDAWTDLGSADDYAISGDDIRWVEHDLSSIPNGTYQFAFATTSTFTSGAYSSGVILDDVVGPDVLELFATTFNVTDGTNPIESAEINISLNGVLFASATTDATGAAVFSVPAEDYTYSVTALGYIPQTDVALTVSADATEDVVMAEAPPELSVSPETFDFGNVYIDFTDAQTFTLSNIGTGALTINSIELLGADAAEFDIASIDGVTDPTLWPATWDLATASSIDVIVDFIPATEGAKIATLSITDNAAKTVTDVTINGNALPRPTGSTCAVPYEVTLPLVDFAGDTEPMGDDYSSAWITNDVNAVSTSYINGNEMVMQFTLTQKSMIEASLTSTGTWVGLFILQDIPNETTPANVLGAAKSGSGSELELSGLVLEAGTYFAIVSSWPTPQTVDFVLNMDATPAYAVDFNVTDGAAAIESASIEVNETTLTTDVNGDATIDLINGAYDYQVSAAGFGPVFGTATVADADQTIDVAMTASYTVTFTVNDGTDPVEDAIVSIEGFEMGMTDASGVLEVQLSDGDYEYTIVKANFLEETGTVTVSGAVAAVNVSLTPTYVITFTIDNGAKAAIEGATISIDGVEMGVTDATGVLEIELAAATYNYEIVKDGFFAETGSFDVVDGALPIGISMDPGYFAEFNIVDNFTAVLEGVNISINADNLTTDAAGFATIQLAPGDYPYTATKAGYIDAEGTISIVDALVSEGITMTTTYSVTFVIDDGTDPVDYAIVTIDGQDLMTNVAGMATIELPTGEYGYSIDAGFCDTYTGTVTINDVVPADIMISMNCPETYSVTFTVNDGTDPLVGAVIDASGFEGLTDVMGMSVIYLPNGVHPFSVDYGFADTYTSTVTVDNAPVVVPTISMVVPDTYTVTFAVTDDGAMPLEGATVNVIGEDISLTTDASGNAYTMLPEASFDYEVSLALYETITDVVEVPVDGITVPVEMSLISYDVTFTVTDGTDAIANATITVNGTDIVTDASGVVIATGLIPASYDYTVVAADYDDVTGAVVVVDQDVAEEVTMVLSVYDVTFTVTDGTDPIEGATVTVDGTDLTTDVDGMAMIADLLPGEYDYTVVAADYEDIAGTVTIVDMNVEESVEMTLIPLYNVVFTVDNANSDLLEGATVTIDATDMMTDASGEAAFVLPVGDYDYTIVLDGYADATGSVSIVDADVAEAITLIETIADPTDVNVVVDGFDATLTYDVPAGAVLTESFETAVPPADWTLDNTNATTWMQVETVSFSTGDVVPQDGAFQAELNWEYSAQDEWLITPSFTVPSGASVTFWSYSGAIGSTNGDHYYVKISTDGGSTWDILWDAVDNAADGYEEVNLALADYAGDDVQLAWQGVDGDGQGLWFTWFIDYITVGNAKEVVTFNDLQFVSKASGNSSVASDRSFSRDGSVVVVSNKSAKAFVDYTIYLDDMTTPYAENVTENSFEFTALAEGSYTAGVQKVYVTGVSEIVTVDFDIVTPVYEVTFTVSEARGPIEGANININDTDITTDASGVATIELADGLYDYTVTAAGFEDYAEQVTVAGAAVSVDVALIGIENVVSNFSIYPNPTSGILNVKAEGNNTVVVLNAIGQVVYTNEVNGEGTIDLTGNASGVYFVRLQSGDKVATQRVILE